MPSTAIDVRLLTTLAEQSQRRARERAARARNAAAERELALINSVQDALAGELEMQAIYDAVGDRIRDVFDAEVVDIAMYDETSGLIHFPYAIERGERSPDEPIELMGFRKHAMETRQSLRLDEGSPRRPRSTATRCCPARCRSRSSSYRSSPAAKRPA